MAESIFHSKFQKYVTFINTTWLPLDIPIRNQYQVMI